MKITYNARFAETLKQASCSMSDLAKAAGYHPVTWKKVRTGARPASPEAGHALVRVLRKRAGLMLRLADKLERAAEMEAKRRK